ncbi:MAG: GNAT family N-acetyltransferase [Candidatus Eremiobacteraeota bacterium]|nr:GNAT family N-acetyltransferase [Candidatus Eremiobacteraeota bacterium]
MSPLAWRCAPFADLTPAELYAALQLRSSVFVVEQRCPFLDPDGDDDRAWHLLGWHGQDGAPNQAPRLMAYARLFAPGIKYAEASIGRVVTHPDARRTGAGRALMAEAVRTMDTLAPGTSVRIGAQQYLEQFYESFGFRRDGADYLEDGIVHVEMIRGR